MSLLYLDLRYINILQLQLQQLQLQRLSRRADDYFEISDFEGSCRIFEIVIPDPWSLLSVVSYNQLTGFFLQPPFKNAYGSHNTPESDLNGDCVPFFPQARFRVLRPPWAFSSGCCKKTC
jgi:hypothetical protein